MHTIFAEHAVSVTELKRNFSAIVQEAEGVVIVLNHNRPEAYLVPARFYEKLISYMEDFEDAKIVLERQDSPIIEVSIDDL
ncbi:type II toxin-antitoxin system Phd/YefM family antitoxin [Neisseria sp. 23W00296]|uniref:type II toxin-antitoxin system Phd/YefM family antitoxin n=1 Tax=unclassified Neisseria TaxID=2623750 RepID=UPI0002A45B86|nr:MULTISPECIES: type II toxin-antitoxin system prevent-host-death family antitoxin [unclassified Neisseria]ASP17407.1 type II toxin-antitoxin system Phd/YefM family antitoxin [Neisseria sp. KEM232]EKY06914.1 prevent-host-death family protein [Neisseria sp. oral taxon 020 str. F0370]